MTVFEHCKNISKIFYTFKHHANIAKAEIFPTHILKQKHAPSLTPAPTLSLTCQRHIDVHKADMRAYPRRHLLTRERLVRRYDGCVRHMPSGAQSSNCLYSSETKNC